MKIVQAYSNYSNINFHYSKINFHNFISFQIEKKAEELRKKTKLSYTFKEP